MKTVKLSDEYQVHCYTDKEHKTIITQDYGNGLRVMCTLYSLQLENISVRKLSDNVQTIALFGKQYIDEQEYLIYAGKLSEVPKELIKQLNEESVELIEGYNLKVKGVFTDDKGILYSDIKWCLDAVCKGFDWIIIERI